MRITGRIQSQDNKERVTFSLPWSLLDKGTNFLSWILRQNKISVSQLFEATSRPMLHLFPPDPHAHLETSAAPSAILSLHCPDLSTLGLSGCPNTQFWMGNSACYLASAENIRSSRKHTFVTTTEQAVAVMATSALSDSG